MENLSWKQSGWNSSSKFPPFLNDILDYDSSSIVFFSLNPTTEFHLHLTKILCINACHDDATRIG